MDPISQGAVGAIAAGALSGKKCHSTRLALLAGWAGGMLADADIFIRSSQDPLLNIEYHRHFTHSLVFIPIGGLVCAFLLWLCFRGRKKFTGLLLFATAGYATSGLLDACTSYGTRLFWPFSETRVAWNIISIVDPIFTLTILVLIGIALKKSSSRVAGIACFFALSYLGLGTWQNHRALQVQEQLIASRGHTDGSIMHTVKPSIGNLVLWRSIYQYDGAFYVDAVRVGFFAEGRVLSGNKTAALQLSDLSEGVPEDSVLAGDLKRFDHFSASYLARHPADPDVVGDLRYAMVPDSLMPLWGIRYDLTQPGKHARFENFRDARDEVKARFSAMLFGTSP